VGAYRDRPHARPSPAVGDAERLVEVQVRHVGPEPARPGQPDQRVEVRHRRGIPGRPRRGRSRRPPGSGSRTRRGSRGYVTMIAASRSACSWALSFRSWRSTLPSSSQATTTTRIPAITRARRVRPVGRRRDQAHVAALVTPAAVVGADREQTRELALRAGVRLQRHCVVARDLRQPDLEVRDQARVAGGLVGRHVGVHAGEPRPGDRDHLGGRVQLHRARAEGGSSCGPTRGPGPIVDAGSAASRSRSGSGGTPGA